MDTNKLIKDIKLENDNLAAHLKRVSKPGFKLHIMDVDVMIDRTKQLYEQLIQLHDLASETVSDKEIKHTVNEPEKISPQVEKPQEAVLEQSAIDKTETIASVEEEKAENEIVEKEDLAQEHQEPKVSKEEPPIEKASTTPSQNDHYEPTNQYAGNRDAEKDDVNETKGEEIDVSTHQQTKVHLHKTTLDLFAEEAPKSLGDKLTPQNDPSIVARIQKSPIVDLRSAIGINDKFLFINELFKGNLSHYNNAIDELNAFQSINGAFTYLIESKVQHQWDEDSQAFKRLKELVERKFS